MKASKNPTRLSWPGLAQSSRHARARSHHARARSVCRQCPTADGNETAKKGSARACSPASAAAPAHVRCMPHAHWGAGKRGGNHITFRRTQALRRDAHAASYNSRMQLRCSLAAVWSARAAQSSNTTVLLPCTMTRSSTTQRTARASTSLQGACTACSAMPHHDGMQGKARRRQHHITLSGGSGARTAGRGSQPGSHMHMQRALRCTKTQKRGAASAGLKTSRAGH